MPRAKQDLNDALVPLIGTRLSKRELELGRFHINQLLTDGLIREDGTQPLAKTDKNGNIVTQVVDGEPVPVFRQGHPETMYRLTDAGRKRAKRRKAAAEKELTAA